MMVLMLATRQRNVVSTVAALRQTNAVLLSKNLSSKSESGRMFHSSLSSTMLHSNRNQSINHHSYESSSGRFGPRFFSTTSGRDNGTPTTSSNNTTTSTTTSTSTTTTAMSALSSSSGSATGTTVRRPMASSSTETPVFQRVVYVHPLSQIILEYFQSHCNAWIVSRGLDRSLTIHRDGTFELAFISKDDIDNSDDNAITNNNNNNHIETKNEAPSPGTTKSKGNTNQQQLQQQQLPRPKQNRIWTSYDEQEKKHWLTIHKGSHLRRRFLLQDNLAGTGTWHGRGGDRKQAQQRIQKAIHDMIHAVEEEDQEREHNHRLLLELQNQELLQQRQQQQLELQQYHHHHPPAEIEKVLTPKVPDSDTVPAMESVIQDNTDGTK